MELNMPCSILAEKLFNVLIDIVREHRCHCIALSGGIDTSAVLLASLKAGIKPRAYIVIYRNGVPGDLIYAEHLAKIFNIELNHIFIDYSHALKIRDDIIKCIGLEKTNSHGDGGCIEIRNDIVFYSVLAKAKSDGCDCIYVGSGGDEVFTGYNFMLNLIGEELKNAIKKLSRGRFPELEIAKCINIDAVAPLLNEKAVELAYKIPLHCLRSDKFQGKEVLREILNGVGLHTIAERIKMPAESGSGTKSFCKSIYDELQF